MEGKSVSSYCCTILWIDGEKLRKAQVSFRPGMFRMRYTNLLGTKRECVAVTISTVSMFLLVWIVPFLDPFGGVVHFVVLCIIAVVISDRLRAGRPVFDS